MNIAKTLLLSVTLLVAASAVNAQELLPYQDESLPLEVRVQDALSRMTLKEKCRLSYAQSKFSSPGCPRLGIPELWMSDGPHGVRAEFEWNTWNYAGWNNDYVTAFPALTCLAATWNTELASLYGKSVGEEARYREKDVLLGPGLNIYRTPLNGRNFEYMGEDPYLSGTMAVPYVIALQKNGVACCLKHYVLNDQEEYRGFVDVKVSDRALHEIYLRPFARVIAEADPWSVMGSYNRYKGIHNTHNPYLINDILKGELGFKGALITDWGAAHNTNQAALYGLDLEMGSYTNGLTTEANGFGYDDYYLGNAYYEMALNGDVPASVVDDKAGRVLALIFKTAMNTRKPFGSINTDEHKDVARRIGEEGIVLLKNDAGILPLQSSAYHNVLVVGQNADRSLCMGGGSSELKAKDEVSPLRGLKERFGKDWNIEYEQGYECGKSMYGGIDAISEEYQDSLRQAAVSKAAKADLVIYIGGLNKNHFEDCEGGDRLSYNMSYGQDKLISDLLAVQPNTVLVLVSGNAVAMPWLPQARTLVQSWYLGSEAGHALAAVLSGDVNPSGKTVFTYAASLEDYPAHKYGLAGYPGVAPDKMPAEYCMAVDAEPASATLLKNIHKKADPLSLNDSKNPWTHFGTGKEMQIYAEDILVGYRYFDTMKQPVVFPFGYGLSYTTFSYSDASVCKTDQGWKVSVKVTNTGGRSGKEVVQLYVSDVKSSVVRPEKELKGYAKLSLEPGQADVAEFLVTEDDLKFYDETTGKWTLEPGKFKLGIGASSRDIKATLTILVD